MLPGNEAPNTDYSCSENVSILHGAFMGQKDDEKAEVI
jgi:hypothetical protein